MWNFYIMFLYLEVQKTITRLWVFSKETMYAKENYKWTQGRSNRKY